MHTLLRPYTFFITLGYGFVILLLLLLVTEESQCIDPTLEAINHAVKEYNQQADGEGGILAMVGSPSGKFYTVWRRLEDQTRLMTQAEEVYRIESDIQEETVKKYKQSKEYFDNRKEVIKGPFLSKERIVVGAIVYLINYELRYIGGDGPDSVSGYQVLVFQNSKNPETGDFIEQTVYNQERIEELRNQQTSLSYVRYQNSQGTMTGGTIPVPVDSGMYIIDLDENDGCTEIVVKNYHTRIIVEESDMTPDFYKHVKVARKRMKGLNKKHRRLTAEGIRRNTFPGIQ